VINPSLIYFQSFFHPTNLFLFFVRTCVLKTQNCYWLGVVSSDYRDDAV